MQHQPDLHHDIDALFDHLTGNLGHEPDEEREWHFALRSEDLAKLERLAESLSEEFDVHLQEEVETIEEDRTFMGPPLLSVVITAALSPDEVKAYAARFKGLAAAEGLTYDGVEAFEAVDMDELFGWLDLEAAIWRLRHFSDSGFEDGGAVPFTFAIEASDRVTLESVAATLEAEGFEDVEIIDDDEVGMGLVVQCEGRNDEALLTQFYNQIETLATAARAELLGVQFFDSDDAVEEEDDESGLDGRD